MSGHSIDINGRRGIDHRVIGYSSAYRAQIVEYGNRGAQAYKADTAGERFDIDVFIQRGADLQSSARAEGASGGGRHIGRQGHYADAGPGANRAPGRSARKQIDFNVFHSVDFDVASSSCSGDLTAIGNRCERAGGR